MKLKYPNQKLDELLIQLRNEINKSQIQIIEKKIIAELLFSCDFIVCFKRETMIHIEKDYTVKETFKENFMYAIDEDLDRLIILFTDTLAYFRWRDNRDIDEQVLYFSNSIDQILKDVVTYDLNGLVINPETDDIVIKNRNLSNYTILKNIKEAFECKTSSKMMSRMISNVRYCASKNEGFNKVWIKRNNEDFIYIIIDTVIDTDISKLKEVCDRVTIEDNYMIVDSYMIEEEFNLKDIHAIYEKSKG